MIERNISSVCISQHSLKQFAPGIGQPYCFRESCEITNGRYISFSLI